MTDQEYEEQMLKLMSGERTEKKKGFHPIRSVLAWSPKRKKITAAAAVVLVLGLVITQLGKGQGAQPAVSCADLGRSDIEEILSISGPISGSDSAEVVSRLHAEILELLVKEGDRVEKGQVLARLDRSDVERQVDMARNAYELALANQERAQKDAESGYAKARQDLEAASRDYDRRSLLYGSGNATQVELEEAADALAEARRQVDSYTLEEGRAVADRSYGLQVRDAEFELEQKQEQLEETEVTSPIEGTVVRVNTRVGRFADTVDNDKPLFVIDNLDSLEMKINVSEYSIGKVRLGQTAEISADILGGKTVEGVIAAISPTGEEKGGGSSERVIPTTIRIENPDSGLIAGITARAKIGLNRAEQVFTVPVSALLQQEDGSQCLVAVENGIIRRIPVETGVESDVAAEVISEELTEGLSYVTSPDPSLTDGMAVTVLPVPMS